MTFVANLRRTMNIRQVSVWVTILKSGIRRRASDRPRGFVGYPGGQWRTCGVESRQQIPSLRTQRKCSNYASVAPSIYGHLGTVEAEKTYFSKCSETSQFTVGLGTANLLAPYRAVWVSISHQNTCCQEQIVSHDSTPGNRQSIH